jgi:hypothetical protein
MTRNYLIAEAKALFVFWVSAVNQLNLNIDTFRFLSCRNQKNEGFTLAKKPKKQKAFEHIPYPNRLPNGCV